MYFIAATRLFQRVAAMDIFASRRIYIRRDAKALESQRWYGHRCDSSLRNSVRHKMSHWISQWILLSHFILFFSFYCIRDTNEPTARSYLTRYTCAYTCTEFYFFSTFSRWEPLRVSHREIVFSYGKNASSAQMTIARSKMPKQQKPSKPSNKNPLQP